jgi:WhiB family transcriptional regulator, redox-sensing transcriptional regulator
MDWRHRANCRDAPPNLFFAADREPGEVTQAKAEYAIQTYCNPCPVRGECLRQELASDTREHGVWGGLTDKQRHGSKRKAGNGRKAETKPTRDLTKALKETT